MQLALLRPPLPPVPCPHLRQHQLQRREILRLHPLRLGLYWGRHHPGLYWGSTVVPAVTRLVLVIRNIPPSPLELAVLRMLMDTEEVNNGETWRKVEAAAAMAVVPDRRQVMSRLTVYLSMYKSLHQSDLAKQY